MLGGELLGFEEDVKGVVAAVVSAVGPGGFERVPDTALDGQRGCVEARAEVHGQLDIAASPSSIAVVIRWMATYVGPKAIHMALASRRAGSRSPAPRGETRWWSVDPRRAMLRRRR